MSEEKYHYTKAIDQETVNRGETSHAKLLQWVKPGSRVLECGCAYGIMTRYMKEQLGCYVSILELDLQAFEQAKIYADDGCCANLEDDDWMVKIPQQFFDYILYADVLEHMRDPETVLKKMRRFLKQDGSVLLSVPNVAYGDIIMNLLCDQFTYTPLGLLDNTHIHLFARKNLHDMVKSAGYYMAEEDCTLVPLFASEQGVYLPENNKKELEEALSSHATRNVYQFVCRLTQKEVSIIKKIENVINYELLSDISSRIYYDDGSGFCEENRIDIQGVLKENQYIYHVAIPSGCTQIRYDPTESQKCIVKNISVHCGETKLPVLATNGVGFESSYFFVNEDPQILFSLENSDACTISIEVEVVLLTALSWRQVDEFLQNQNRQYIDVIARKEEQLQAVNAAKENVEHALAIKEEQLQAVNAAKEDVERAHDIAESKLFSSERDKRRLNREREIALQEKERLQLKINEIERQAQRLSCDIVSIQNSLSWKITKPLRLVKRLIRHE